MYVNIYIYMHIYIYIYIYIWSHIHTQTHTYPEPPRMHWNISTCQHLETEWSASPHLLLHHIVNFTLSFSQKRSLRKNRKQWIWGPTYPVSPNAKVSLLNLFFWFLWFLGLPPKPQVGLLKHLHPSYFFFVSWSSPHTQHRSPNFFWFWK